MALRHREVQKLQARIRAVEQETVVPSAGQAAVGDAATLQGHPASDFSLTTHNHDSVYNALANGTSGISWATGWADSGATVLRRGSNGVVVLNLSASYSGGGGATICTLPSGYRPVAVVNTCGMTGSIPGTVPAGVTIGTSGVVTLLASAASFVCSITFTTT